MIGMGRALMRGAMIEAAKWASVGFGFVLVVHFVLQTAGFGWDATDDRANSLHSEMRLRTDYGSGCQYLESRTGALTPRLDRNGKQVCL